MVSLSDLKFSFPKPFTLLLIVSCFLSTTGVTSGSTNSDVKLKTWVNPNCEDYKSCDGLTEKPDLVYTQTTIGNHSSIHFVASTLGGFPGLLVTRTSSDEPVRVNWDSLLGDCHQSFDFSTLPDDSIAILFLSFFDLDHKNIRWALEINGSLPCDSSRCSFDFTSSPRERTIKPTLIINLEMRSDQSFYVKTPHLVLKPSSMHIDLQLKDLTKEQTEKKAGGVHLLVANSGQTYISKMTSSIDDEESPGIFKKQTFRFDGLDSMDSGSSSYIEWKPVAYTSDDRAMSKTLNVLPSTLDRTEMPRLNLPLYCFYRQSKSNYSVYMLNVTLEPEADDKSKSFDLVAWSLVFGLGSPVEESLSLYLKLIIFLGVGSSFVIMIISLVYVAIKQWQRSRAANEPSLLNNVMAGEY